VIGPVPIEGNRIQSITDVGNDQGLEVRINFRGSPYDVLGSPTPIVQYEAFRRIDPGNKGAATPSDLQLSVATPGFEFVGAVPAHGESEYNMVVPTVQDGANTGFFVRAATAQPLVYYDSCEVEGSSVDNLAPPPPGGLVVGYGASGNDLTWDDVDAPDLVGFRVYRDTDPGFVPAPGNLVHTTESLGWFDAVTDPFTQHYKVAAYDDGSNESSPADPSTVTGVDEESDLPRRWALRGVVPNPFNPRTTIVVEAPQHGGEATVGVYDVAGRLVDEVFAGKLAPGTQRIEWDATDSAGQRVSSGTYFVRVVASGLDVTRKITLLK
jgi:hypothetical protein